MVIPQPKQQVLLIPRGGKAGSIMQTPETSRGRDGRFFSRILDVSEAVMDVEDKITDVGVKREFRPGEQS